MYNDTSIESVPEIMYLGTRICKSGVFLKAAEKAVSKDCVASKAVRELCVKIHNKDWLSKQRLCQAILMSTLLQMFGP